MLVHSILIESPSKLLVIGTGMKAWASLILGLWFPWPNLLSSGVLDDIYQLGTFEKKIQTKNVLVLTTCMHA